MGQQAFALDTDAWAPDTIDHRGSLCDLLYCPTGDYKDRQGVRNS